MGPKLLSRATEPIDHWLEAEGYYRKHTARDGSCLFRAVAEQVFYTQAVHEDVRRQCVEYMRKHSDLFQQFLDYPIFEYLKTMSDPKQRGGRLELEAISRLYRRDIIVFEEIDKAPCVVVDNGYDIKILLCLSYGHHYDSVYLKSYIMKAGFCQSIAYQLLYERVFKIPDVGYAVEKMLHDKSNYLRNQMRRNHLTNQNFIQNGRFGALPLEFVLERNKIIIHEDGPLDMKEILAQGFTPFPYKVAKALDPDMYRNIAFDTWSEMCKGLKLGWCSSDGDLQVGVKCLVKMESDMICHAHIQEMEPNHGPVMIYVEELGKKCTVPYESLEILPRNVKSQPQLAHKRFRQWEANQQKMANISLSIVQGESWKRQKTDKSRKAKEAPMPVAPRLQVDNTRLECSSQITTRFLHQSPVSPGVHMNYHGYPQENSNTAQNYTNIGVNMPGVPMSLVLEQGNMPGCQATLQLQDSTMPQNFESSVSYAGDGSLPTAENNSEPQPAMESRLSNSSTSLAAPQQHPDPTPQQSATYSAPFFVPERGMLCKDVNGNYAVPYSVNYGAMRSVHPAGLDLPLSDVQTLRFFYNLGIQYFHMNQTWNNSSLENAYPATTSSHPNLMIAAGSTSHPDNRTFVLPPPSTVESSAMPLPDSTKQDEEIRNNVGTIVMTPPHSSAGTVVIAAAHSTTGDVDTGSNAEERNANTWCHISVEPDNNAASVGYRRDSFKNSDCQFQNADGTDQLQPNNAVEGLSPPKTTDIADGQSPQWNNGPPVGYGPPYSYAGVYGPSMVPCCYPVDGNSGAVYCSQYIGSPYVPRPDVTEVVPQPASYTVYPHSQVMYRHPGGYLPPSQTSSTPWMTAHPQVVPQQYLCPPPQQSVVYSGSH